MWLDLGKPPFQIFEGVKKRQALKKNKKGMDMKKETNDEERDKWLQYILIKKYNRGEERERDSII